MTKASLAVLCIALSGSVFAQPAPPVNAGDSAAAPNTLDQANGMLMLDYAKFGLKGGGTFDLLGAHYLHQMNDWLYLGVGISGPLLQGNYGGLFFVDTTLHAQKKVLGNWFVDAGVAIGGGGGGASIRNIKQLSGAGRYVKKYVGLGYDHNGVYYGVNYANIDVAGSPIKDSALNFFIQKPVSFWAGSFSDAGNRITPSGIDFGSHDSVISLELNHMTQIHPQGLYRGNIGLVSPQFSHFFSKHNYLYFGFDLGISGLDWYNQIHGGIGHRIAISPDFNVYAQLGIGSGGWVTDTIDTGPGLLIYPKVKAEYMLSKGLGLSLSAGYLAAPKGTSKNWTVGAGLSFHLSPDGGGTDNTHGDVMLRGLRVNLYDKLLMDVNHNGVDVKNINMTALQLDYVLNNSFYIPFQIAAATSAYKGYAGYTEMFVGLGWQSHRPRPAKLNGFAQVSLGLNDLGIDKQQDVGPLLNAAVGLTYDLNKRFSLYGQLSRTVSVKQHIQSSFSNNFEATSVGLGLTYRFSFPTRSSQ